MKNFFIGLRVKFVALAYSCVSTVRFDTKDDILKPSVTVHTEINSWSISTKVNLGENMMFCESIGVCVIAFCTMFHLRLRLKYNHIKNRMT